MTKFFKCRICGLIVRSVDTPKSCEKCKKTSFSELDKDGFEKEQSKQELNAKHGKYRGGYSNTDLAGIKFVAKRDFDSSYPKVALNNKFGKFAENQKTVKIPEELNEQIRAFVKESNAFVSIVGFVRYSLKTMLHKESKGKYGHDQLDCCEYANNTVVDAFAIMPDMKLCRKCRDFVKEEVEISEEEHKKRSRR